MKSLVRSLLRSWARIGKAPGLYCQMFEKLGPALANGRVETRLPNGCVMQCDLTDEVQRFIYFVGTYEPVEAQVFCRLLRPGATVIDAGANVGQYTLLAATRVGPEGQVHSFEPMPQNFSTLSRNVQINGLTNVRLNQVALWHEPAELVFSRPRVHHHNNGAFAAINPGGSPDDIDSQATISVPAMPLDQYVEENHLTSVDLIKMDIEGAEPFLLQGGRRTLERFGPPILSEVRPEILARLGTTIEQFETLLTDLGYRAWLISGENNRPIEHLTDVPDPNVLFYRSPLPPEALTDVPLKSALRWARSGWDRRGLESARSSTTPAPV